MQFFNCLTCNGNVQRNGTPREFCEIFRNDYGLDQLRKRLLLKESYTAIYCVQINFLERKILRKL